MTLNQNGIEYICQNFGLKNCCVHQGLRWYYTGEGEKYNETGGTAQVVSRLALGLIESLTMVFPNKGTFTQAELNTANGDLVTLEDAQEIANHDQPSEDQWCYGAPPPPEIPLALVIGGIAAVAIIGGYLLFKKRGRI